MGKNNLVVIQKELSLIYQNTHTMKQVTEQHIRSKAKYLVTAIGEFGCQEYEAYHICDAANWKGFLNMKGYTSIIVYKIIKKTKELKEINL